MQIALAGLAWFPGRVVRTVSRRSTSRACSLTRADESGTIARAAGVRPGTRATLRNQRGKMITDRPAAGPASAALGRSRLRVRDCVRTFHSCNLRMRRSRRLALRRHVRAGCRLRAAAGRRLPAGGNGRGCRVTRSMHHRAMVDACSNARTTAGAAIDAHVMDGQALAVRRRISSMLRCQSSASFCSRMRSGLRECAGL